MNRKYLYWAVYPSKGVSSSLSKPRCWRMKASYWEMGTVGCRRLSSTSTWRV
jgi:hypothetical protein